MIRYFGDHVTKDLFYGRTSAAVRRVPDSLRKAIVRKLDMMEASASLDDLRVPPGNRLEALRGDMEGWFSIRVNDQWRLVFRWQDAAVEDVRLMDYH
jgi:proteic killer suppression protein